MEFRSIDELAKKGQLSGEEKLPVSPTEYVSTEQISDYSLNIEREDFNGRSIYETVKDSDVFATEGGYREIEIRQPVSIVFEPEDGGGYLTVTWTNGMPVDDNRLFKMIRGSAVFSVEGTGYDWYEDHIFIAMPPGSQIYEEFRVLWEDATGTIKYYTVGYNPDEYFFKEDKKLIQESVKNLPEDLDKLRKSVSVINVDRLYPKFGGGYYSEVEAREAIEESLQANGLVITYRRSQTEWTTERFVGNLAEEDAWFDASNWIVEKQSYRKTINRDEVSWYENKFIHIPHNTSLESFVVTNIDLKVRLGTSLRSLTASVFYPAAETNTANVPTGFYISDIEGILNKGSDFGAINLSYDIQLRSEPYFQYSRTRYQTGKNIIVSHNTGENLHATSVVNSITAVYPEFEHQILRTDLDSNLLAKVTNRHKAKYVDKVDADCIVIPYQNATVVENNGGIADILQVTAHRDNVFQRYDLGETEPEKFKPYVIACGARVDDTTTPVGSSYGFGLEFFENTGNETLNELYPETTFQTARYTCTLNADPTILDITYSIPARNPFNLLEFEEGVTVLKIGQIGNLQTRTLVEIINANQIRVDSPLDPLPAGTNIVYYDIHIGTLWQPVRYIDYPTNTQPAEIYGQYQSASAPIVAAKFKKIQAATNMSWNVIREAARATASNNGVWDMYRGYGIVNVDAAIQYIKDNYTENETFIAGESDKYNGTKAVNKVIRYQDISQDAPIAKRHFDDLIEDKDIVVDADYVHTDNNYTDEEKSKVIELSPIYWDEDNNTFAFPVPDGGAIEIGQEPHDYYSNLSGGQLINGDVVSVISATGNRTAITKTDATDDDLAKACIGMVTVDVINNNAVGRITKDGGKVRTLNTSAYEEGDILYVDPLSPGKWTSIKPEAPYRAVQIGVVSVKHATEGVVELIIRVLPKFTELADVDGSTTEILDDDKLPIQKNVGGLVKFLSFANLKTVLSGVYERLSNKKQTVTNSATDYPSGAAVTAALALKVDKSEVLENTVDIRRLENVVNSANINQETTATATGVDVVALPKTAANTGMKVQLFGQSAQNLVVNGDFRNGTTGWAAFSGSTLLMSGVKLRVERTTGALAVNQALSFIGSNKYYVAVTGVTTDMSDFYIYMGNFTRIDQTGYSCIHTPSSSGREVVVGRAVYIDGTYFEASSIKVINLTATFGAGNEPTKEQCDILFANYFEGSDNVLGAGRVRSVGKNLIPREDIIQGARLNVNGTYVFDPSSQSIGVIKGIPVLPSTTYRLSGMLNFIGFYGWFYDKFDNPISIRHSIDNVNSYLITTPANAYFFRFREYYIGTKTIDEAKATVMLERASTATPYEPYRQSILQLTTPPLRSNGLIKDEIRKGTNGYELVKRVGVGTLGAEVVVNGGFDTDIGWIKAIDVTISGGTFNINSAAGVTSNTISSTGYLIPGTLYKIVFTVVSISRGHVSVRPGHSATAIARGTTGTFTQYTYHSGNNFIYITGIGGAICSIDNVSFKPVSVAEAIAATSTFTELGSNVHFTLATPTITPIPHAGLLNSNSNGTAYFEPIIADAGVYSTNLTVQLTDYPIASFESIRKYANGTYTELNPTTAVIASGGLSFTHPDLVSGDLVMFTYAYNKESIGRNMTLTHYDNRYVKVDTANGKTYRIDFRVTNGVVVPTATEV